MGFIKYIIPIGTLLIAIYMTHNDKEYMTHKLIQYGIFLLCIAAMLSIFQVGKDNLSLEKEFTKIIEEAYYLGEKDIGGGAIGGIIAVPLIKALGNTRSGNINNRCSYYITCIYVWYKTSPDD